MQQQQRRHLAAAAAQWLVSARVHWHLVNTGLRYRTATAAADAAAAVPAAAMRATPFRQVRVEQCDNQTRPICSAADRQVSSSQESSEAEDDETIR